MPGTRARQIRRNIVEALVEIVFDHRAGTTDTLKFYDQPRPPEALPERTFRLPLTANPKRGDLQTTDNFQVEFTLEEFLSLAPGAESRACDDSERYWWVLETLQSRNDGIQGVFLTPLGIEDTRHNAICRTSIVVDYRLDSTLVS